MIDGTFTPVLCKIPFSQRPKCLGGLGGITPRGLNAKMVFEALM